MAYVDGFVIPIAKKNLPQYKKIAKLACKVWLEHGALAYHECVGEDLNLPYGLPFPKLTKAKPGETVLFSWIVYKNKAHRNKINKLVMADPRIAAMCNPGNMPVDLKRMACGGFQPIVSGEAK